MVGGFSSYPSESAGSVLTGWSAALQRLLGGGGGGVAAAINQLNRGGAEGCGVDCGTKELI